LSYLAPPQTETIGNFDTKAEKGSDIMKTNCVARAAFAAGLLSRGALADDTASACAAVLTPTYSPLPAVASGWQAQLVAGGLKKPRSIQFDSTGALLVVDSGVGVVRYSFNDTGATCLQANQQQLLINQTNVSLHAMQHVSRIFFTLSGS